MPTVNDRPGAFELSDVFLISYAEGTEGNPKRLNIRNLITEFNIYEKLVGIEIWLSLDPGTKRCS